MIVEYKVNTLDELINVLESKKDCIFRGVSDSSYKLCPQFFRGLIGKDVDDLNDSTLENLLEQHKTFVNFITNSRGHKKASYELYFTGQHYGFNTKLLDFTFKYEIALAFAVYDWLYVSDTTKDCGIYILKYDKLKTIKDSINSYNNLLNTDNCLHKIEHILIKPNNRSKSDVRQRITKQHGCFVYFKGYSKEGYYIDDYEFIHIGKELVHEIRNGLKKGVFGESKINSLDDLK